MLPRASCFEELIAWQRARQLRLELEAIIRDGKFGRDFDLMNQVRAAATSVMANIAEGFERDGKREFSHHLSVARGSVGEVRSHLYAALDSGYLTAEQFSRLAALSDEVSRIIAGLRASVIRSLNATPPTKRPG